MRGRKRVWFNHKNSLVFGFFATLFIVADALCSTPFSQYGMIQNVRDYSSNPFYNSNTATVTAPKVIDASGPDLKNSDCQTVVKNLINLECNARNKCFGVNLVDIRPELMKKLSLLPGHNYATTCSGYISYMFDEYIKENQTQNYLVPSSYGAGFPSVTGTSTTKQNIPQWKQDYNDRAEELRLLQQMTGTTEHDVIETDFPTTFNDLSFEQKNNIKRQGYEPYKDAQPYIPITIIEDKTKKEEKKKAKEKLANTALQQVYDCIENYGKKAEIAQKNWYEIRTPENIVSSSDSISTVLNQTNNALYDAFIQALTSPCICSKNNMFRDKILKSIQVENVDGTNVPMQDICNSPDNGAEWAEFYQTKYYTPTLNSWLLTQSSGRI